MYLYVCVCMYISGHKRSTTHRVIKALKSRMGVTYMLS